MDGAWRSAAPAAGQRISTAILQLSFNLHRLGALLDETLSSTPREGSSHVARAHRLKVVFGKNRGLVQVLEKEPVLIGRKGHVEGALALDDLETSKRHARVVWDASGNGWELVDEGSRNGTFLNGARCSQGLLQKNAVIRIGASLLLFEEVEFSRATALEPASETLPGPSIAMQKVRGEIRQVAQHSIPVLIFGETGVGKELVAEEIHRQSKRSGPFIPLNCAALPTELAESELFGHLAGSFTGANGRSEGLFAAAHQGTLFLDEIGELPPSIQPKLLRALATGEYRPVGSNARRHADVRIVAATHRDLREASQGGTFREDLLARLNGWNLFVPPLRDRKEDVLALATHFLQRAPSRPSLSADAGEALLIYDWPQNVRQLEQVLAVAAVRAAGPLLKREHLPPLAGTALDAMPEASPERPSVPLQIAIPNDTIPSREQLLEVLKQAEGNVSQVASFFGKDRRQVYRWMKSLDIPIAELRRS